MIPSLNIGPKRKREINPKTFPPTTKAKLGEKERGSVRAFSSEVRLSDPIRSSREGTQEAELKEVAKVNYSDNQKGYQERCLHRRSKQVTRTQSMMLPWITMEREWQQLHLIPPLR
ncbi:unnamed protein product, partial [Vitis vinifera]